jgi:outer membrane protein assembly factor BamB
MHERRPCPLKFTARLAIVALVAAMFAVASGAAGAVSTWPVYHGNPAHTGNDTSEPALLPAHQGWSATLDQKVYGQPLVFAGRVFAATENNTVYALDAHDGHRLWASHVGTPVTNIVGQAGCGNIDPLGITSTAVIDTARNEIFVVAEIADGPSAVHHQLFGFDAYTGARLLSVNVDPGGGQNPLYIQQRAGLALANGRIYVGFGGLAGDCGPYHGWLVSVTETGTGKLAFNVTPHTGLGAIWAPPGPSVDSTGHVFVATGNPNPNVATHDYGESVLKLDATLHVLANFSGSNATDDFDLGSTSPALVSGNMVFQVGKQNVGYLLDAGNLALLKSLSICTNMARGGTAFDGSRLFVNCSEHVQAVNIDVAHRTMTKGWSGPATSTAGPPILAGGSLWSVDVDTGVLYALNPATGAVRTTVALGGVPHFTSPSAGLALLLIGTNHGVTALAGPSGVPPHAPPPPSLASCKTPANHDGYWTVARDGALFAFGGAPYCGSASGLLLSHPIVGMTGTPTGHGYWLVAADGGIFSFGDARFFGSTGAIALKRPIVGMAATPSGHGYWLVASDGGIFAFGDAHFYGSTGALRLNRPVVGMASTPNGGGYWLVASDGGIFAFGNAHFSGSTGAMRLNRPVVGMASTPNGGGYWLVASDGGIFAFGNAHFYGSTGALHLHAPIVGMASTRDGGGYRFVASDGGIFAFGDAKFFGTHLVSPFEPPIVGVARD